MALTDLSASPSVKDGLAIIVVAAGSGTRLGYGMPKALVPLAGRPILDIALESVARALPSARIIVTVPAGDTELSAIAVAHGAHAVTGGATRAQSVACALAAVDCAATYVLVHDAARCLVPARVTTAVVAALAAGERAVVPVLPVNDTVRGVDAQGHSAGTVDRSGLRAVQTPQGFDADLLVDVNHQAGLLELDDQGALTPVNRGADPEGITDDASLIERFARHVPVTLVAGHDESFKITRPFDLVTARAVLEERAHRAVADHVAD